MIEVRTAVFDDADDLARAHVDAWRVGYRGIIPDDYLDDEHFERQRVDQWRAWTWRRPGSELFVGLLGGRAIGFGLCGPQQDAAGEATGLGEVFAFYVHPTAWGTGVAAAMMSRCISFLRSEGYPSAWLWVLRDNPRARAFYDKAGWTFTGGEQLWHGPSIDLPLPQPVTEVQYFIALTATR